MSAESHRPYRPYRAVHPGEVLRDELEARGWTQKELAERMGRPAQTINQIVNEKKGIASQTACELERVLGVAASFG